MKDIKLHYDDISIVPETTTIVESRRLCYPYVDGGMLPIFASPMGSVIDENNYETFLNNKINVVIPRTVSLEDRLRIVVEKSMYRHLFVAFSLDEVETHFLNFFDFGVVYSELSSVTPLKICIDLANGHMQKLLDGIKAIKDKYGDKIIVMSGNIANPKTYKLYDDAGCDYVRVSIGTGSACLTASNTGIYYPPFSLLKDIYAIKKKYKCNCKIIADGGIKGFRDIQKALIYADYVMIGGLFNKCIESSGDTTYGKSWIKIGNFKIRNYILDFFRKGKVVDKNKYGDVMAKVKLGLLEVNKVFYGMSTKYAQVKTHTNKKLKTSEGIIKTQNVEYSLKQWVENEESYLRSAMSYTDSLNLNEYKESYWVVTTGISHNK